jgi:Carboxypeptidase regulatory-like domain
VTFLAGSKDDFTKPGVEKKVVPGNPKDGDRRVWEATLPLPKDTAGTVVVTARFTSGVGLTTLASTEVRIVEPIPSPEEAAAAKLETKELGAIEGTVTENDLAQPGIEVLLIDAKAKDAEGRVKSKMKTNQDGTYAFIDLEPGRYRVYCEKPATSRRDTGDVTVPSGKTVRQDLYLKLPRVMSRRWTGPPCHPTVSTLTVGRRP